MQRWSVVQAWTSNVHKPMAGIYPKTGLFWGIVSGALQVQDVPIARGALPEST